MNILFVQIDNRIYQNRMAVRCGIVAWCIAWFVLIQSYICTLTSVITLVSDEKPLIQSLYDIPKVIDSKIAVQGGTRVESGTLVSGCLLPSNFFYRTRLHSFHF